MLLRLGNNQTLAALSCPLALTLCTDPCLGLASFYGVSPIPQILVCQPNCSSNWISSISRLCLTVVVDIFQEYTHTATDRPTRGWLVKLGMEESSRRGKGIASSVLPSLPPRPEEISSEPVSLEPHSGQARPAENSASLRVSPLTVAAPSTSTTTGCPASAATVERLFSQVGIAFSAKRQSADPETLQNIMFARFNLP